MLQYALYGISHTNNKEEGVLQKFISKFAKSCKKNFKIKKKPFQLLKVSIGNGFHYKVYAWLSFSCFKE